MGNQRRQPNRAASRNSTGNNGGITNVTPKSNPDKRKSGSKNNRTKASGQRSGKDVNGAQQVDSRGNVYGGSITGSTGSNRPGSADIRTTVRSTGERTNTPNVTSGMAKSNPEVVSSRKSANGNDNGNKAIRTKNNVRSGQLLLSQTDALKALWRCLFADLCPDLVGLYDKSIADYGLSGTIARFSKLAGVLINNQVGSILDDDLLYGLRNLCDMKTALQLLRFGKRFTPTEWSDSDELRLLHGFHARNNRAKLIDRGMTRFVPNWFAQLCKPIGEEIFRAALRGNAFSCNPYERTYEEDLRALPHGTTAEGLRSPFSKWLACAVSHGQIDPSIAQGVNVTELGCLDPGPSRMVFVPKDYRGPRIIAEEMLERTLQQTVVANAIDRVINTPSFSRYSPYGRITLNDQTRNQSLAERGAKTKSLATIDLSNASDCITSRLLYATLPDEVANAITTTASKAITLPTGETIDLYIPCTMGSRNTVPGQSTVYWVIIAASIKLASDMFNIPCNIGDCSVYNDDIIVPCEVYDIVTMMLTIAGLIVNDDKSYTGDHPFRESCGTDWYDDTEVSSQYWPRKDLRLVPDELPSLCKLQNRLYDLGARQAAQYMNNLIKQLCDKVPTITPGSEAIGLYGLITSMTSQPYAIRVKDDVVSKTCYCIRDNTHGGSLISCDPIYVSHVTKDVGMRLVHQRTLSTWRELCSFLPTGRFTFVRFDSRLDNRTFVNPPVPKTVPDVPIWVRTRQVVVDKFYLTSQPTIVQTYNNTLVPPTLCDSRFITTNHIHQLLELFEYEMWLLNGSEFYDPLCEWLHVTQPSRRGKHMVPKGYRVSVNRYTTYRDAGSPSVDGGPNSQ